MERYAASRLPHTEAILHILQWYGGLEFGERLHVLYAGCSFGHEPILVAGRTKWQVAAFDIDTGALRELPELRKLCNVVACDARKVAFRKNTFDVVILNHVMDAAPDYHGIVEEAWRVLKQGGILYIANNNINRLLCMSVHETPRHPVHWLLCNIRFYRRKITGSLLRERYGDGEGFSYSEMQNLLTLFTEVNCLDKIQLVIRFGRSPLVRLLPESFLRCIGPNHIFLCRKP